MTMYTKCNNKATTLRRSLAGKRFMIAGLFVIALLAGFMTTTVFNQQTWLKEYTLVIPVHKANNQSALIQNYAQLPLRFEQNRGQAGSDIHYLSRGAGYTLYLTRTATVVTLHNHDDDTIPDTAITTRLVGADLPVTFQGKNELPGKVNYLKGRDASDWITKIPTYTDVIAKAVYPGIDLRYHGDQQQLEYDFIVAPGARTENIKLRFEGIKQLSLNAVGDLVLQIGQGSLQHKKPIIYQDINGERLPVNGYYTLHPSPAASHTADPQIIAAKTPIVGFEIGDYDPAYPLIIDPVLDYSTYLGGEADDQGLAIAVDSSGSAYVAGITSSTTFPTATPYQSILMGSRDAFIAKLNPAGDALVYATYFGGSGDEGGDENDDVDDEAGEDDNDDNDDGDSDNDRGMDIVVDSAGHLYITGATSSDADFPIVNALQASYGGGGSDAYIAKLSTDGSSLIFSTYLGGSNKDNGFGIALDATADIYTTGITQSTDFPVINALQSSKGGATDAYIAKLSSDGSSMSYATYIGGSKADTGKAIAVDSQGNAIITGETKSNKDFPLQNALQPGFGGSRDAFVTQLSSDGGAINYSTYIGGSKKDKGRGIAIDSQGNAIVVGLTKSTTDFPLINALQSTYGGGSDDGFISKLADEGSVLNFSTYLGGEKTDKLRNVAIDTNDDLYVVGTTKSTTGIPTTDAIQIQLSGNKRDAFITKLSHDGSSVIYGTYFGGSQNDRGQDIAVNEQDAYITGITQSDLDFPVQNALQTLFGGGSQDTFIAKIGAENSPPEITSTPITIAVVGQVYSYDVDATNPNGGALLYNLQIFPTGMVIAPDTGEITWTPDTVGDVDVTVLVDDNNGGIDSQNFTITVIDPDNIAPTVTITSPVDNLLTNQANQTITGSLSESAALTLNGSSLTVNQDLTFSTTVNLAEGTNQFILSATDAANNNGSTSLTLHLDTVSPAALDVNLINRGNPQNGIVMVTGNPGAVEAGALLHIINTRTGYEVLTLALSDGSFSINIAAFATDNLNSFAVDSAGNQNVTVPISHALPLTLTLNAIGNITALLGQTSRFTVTANDSSGGPITLGITPVPLPDGMQYNITTGEFSFTPNTSQVGDIELTFSVQTSDELITETITVTVPALNPADPTDFMGRVLDANSFTLGDIVPIVGATITFLGSSVTATTDTNGYFTLSSLPTDAVLFDIDASTASPAPGGAAYGSFREALTLVQQVVNQEQRPFFLPRIDAASVTQVNPGQTTVVHNPNLGITLTVPPNSAKNADGTDFTGELSISEVPLALAPVALPDTFQPALLITVQPVGVTFSSPVPITYRNVDDLPPDTEVDLYQVDRDLGKFVVIGTGLVSADGLHIETISGGVTATTWGAPAPSAPRNPEPVNPKIPDPDNPCNCPKAKSGSTVTLSDGRMGTEFTLPAYRSLETSRALTFLYQTNRANPVPVIPFNIGLRTGRTAIPTTISYELSVAGLKQGEKTFVNSTSLTSGEVIRSGLAFDGSDIKTGMYPYERRVTNNFSRTRIGDVVTGDVLVLNEQHSAFGAGWMLGGLYRLAFNPDGSVLLVSPQGRPINYRPTATPDFFDAPDNDYATFIRNQDGSYTHTEKDGVKMHFAAEGLMTSHEDRNHNITAYTYDTDAKLITITDPVGLQTNLTYTINGLLATVTDPANRITRFEHDVTGNLTKATFPDNTFVEHEYGNDHLMSKRIDERQNVYLHRYDNFGRLIDATLPDGTVRASDSQDSVGLIDLESGEGTAANPAPLARATDVNADYVDGRGHPSSKKLDAHGRALVTVDEVGRTTTHVRDADSNPTQTTRPIGSVVTRTFDNFGNVLTQKEEFNTATTTYTYDSFSLVTSTTNPNNHTTHINRDPVNGNPLSIVNHLSHTTTLQYDSRGLVIHRVSPNGLETVYTYNAQGLMDSKTETPPTGSPGNTRVWSYSYFPTGLLQTVNTPDGITLNYSYDERSFLTSVTDNLNQSINYTYDEHKNRVKTESQSSDGSLALLVDSIYDNRNRLVETRAPHVGIEASISKRILDENSNLTGLIDPNGNPSSNSYDPFNRLKTNTHRENGVTQYTYDDQDRIIQVIAPNGVTTDYEYDIISRRSKKISPDRGTITYTYDLANNVTTITEGRGITATMSYDELERVKTKIYPNTLPGKIEDVTYTYDTCAFGLGYLCARSDESGSYTYDYDAFGNMTAATFTEIEGIVYTMGYRYDDGDHVIQTTYPSGRVVDYTRDGVRRLSAIDTTLNDTAQNVVNNIQYRGDNQMLSCDYGNGLNDTRRYDLQGRLLTQQLTDELDFLIDDRSYSYDKNSNVLNIETNVENNTYSYDKLDRLLSDTIDTDIPIEFSYDLNDNRLTYALQDGTLDESYNFYTDSNRLREQDALQTGAVPIPDIPNRELIYNDAGRLYQLIEEGELKADYFYNDAGQRTRKVNYQADGITVDSITIYHYDQQGYLITETDEQGNLIKDYIRTEGMMPVAQINNSGGTESIIYLYTDHLMTNRLATSQNQSVIWRWEGEAFGNTPAHELAGISVNLRFPGQYFDAETGLHYNYFRYYDPAIGRYITSDPIGLAGGMNTYGSVYQNPINRIDPFGLWSPAAHDALVQYAFEELLPPSEIAALQKYGREFDKSSQSRAESNKHSMRYGDQTAQQAVDGREKFICDSLDSASRQSDRNKALNDFAKAIHPIMDKYSPEHRDENGDPKKWRPYWPFGHSPNEHIGNETVNDLTSQIKQNVTRDMIDAYNRAF